MPPLCDAAIIRLLRTAEVDSSLVRLGDVAEVYAESAEAESALKETPLQPAPLAGTRTRLNASEIQSLLTQRGVATGRLEIEGSAVVLVSRKPEPRPSATPKVIHPAPDSKPVNAEPRTPAPATEYPRRRTLISDISAQDFNLAQEVVENLVRQHLSQAAPDWGTPKIEPLLTTAAAPQILKARQGNLRILNGQVLDEEHFLLTLAVPESSEKTDSVNVKVRIIRRPRVFAPVRTVARGEVLSRSDLVEIETDDARNGIEDPNEIVGKEAVQSLQAGTAVRATQLKEPLLIRRRETVQVISKSGSVRVRQFFVAKQDGRLGETILLEDLDGERTIPAIVTARLQAEIGGTVVTPTKTEPSTKPETELPTGLHLTVLPGKDSIVARR